MNVDVMFLLLTWNGNLHRHSWGDCGETRPPLFFWEMCINGHECYSSVFIADSEQILHFPAFFDASPYSTFKKYFIQAPI